MKIKNLLIVPFLALGMVACGNSQKTDDTQATEKKVVIKAPAFNADSAYTYIQTQADFGPRVPNSQAHRDCGEYLAKQLEKFGAKAWCFSIFATISNNAAISSKPSSLASLAKVAYISVHS